MSTYFIYDHKRIFITFKKIKGLYVKNPLRYAVANKTSFFLDMFMGLLYKNKNFDIVMDFDFDRLNIQKGSKVVME